MQILPVYLPRWRALLAGEASSSAFPAGRNAMTKNCGDSRMEQKLKSIDAGIPDGVSCEM
ncbi:MAG: hypothetical protein DWI22_03495 [Planctomycetota bacterium]|nr:MAG: hypothetical protein DWI22_03495 [Planctomycetota bacterium]